MLFVSRFIKKTVTMLWLCVSVFMLYSDSPGVKETVSVSNMFHAEGLEDCIIVLSFIFFMVCCIVVVICLIRLKSQKKAILTILNTDDLTGLFSLNYFTSTAEKLISASNPNEYELIVLDVDYFRTINMYLGTEVGTEVIKSIADSLKKVYADSDVILTRVTADQFIVLKKIGGRGFIQLVCMHTIIPALEEILGEKYHLSLSIGIYKIDDTSIPIVRIIDRANLARMKGKQIHKTTFNEFDYKMFHTYEIITGITQRMEHALENHEFFAVYQPKVDLDTLQICGAEVLVRWNQPNGVIVYPDDFIPLFESNGFIVDLDLYMFEQVCEFISTHNTDFDIPPISVNVSAKTLEQIQPIEKMLEMVKTYNLEPSQIEIEITESALVDVYDIFSKNIAKLKKNGFAVSIDDFGAGTSTLNRLTKFNADIVKLDKIFLDVDDENKKEYVIVENVISMSKKLNMKVVSEGVETLEQAKILKELGCDIAQGFFFERPLSREDFKNCLINNKVYEM